MEFLTVAYLEKRKPADLLVLPFLKGKKGVEPCWQDKNILKNLGHVLESGDFKGKEGEILFTYQQDSPEKRAVLLGLGESDKITTESLRRAFGSIAKAAIQKKLQNLNVIIPHLPSLAEDLVLRGLCEGILLCNYAYEKLKHDTLQDGRTALIQKVCLIGEGKNNLAQANELLSISKAVYFARDLVNGNADEVTPQHLAEIAVQLSKDLPKVKATILDKKQIEKEKMGLLLAVNRGSEIPPVFIILEYKGDPKSKDHTVVIGKGITYDTGGLNIKSSGMESMKCDMGGAAAALGTIYAAASLKLKVNVTAVIPSTENSVSADSFKPGDVYSSHSGKTVEITNTDAEGRLILADALSYAGKKLHPSRMIVFATLTGAMEITLGSEATGMMSNNDALADLLIGAGSSTFERVWRLPLYEEYKETLKSDFADIKNWNGRSASSIVAAVFTQQFVGDTPWAHLDIASTAYLNENKRYSPKYATGVGVRLMIEFLKNL